MSLIVSFAVGLAVSIIILIISMLITSRIWAGIDFGSLQAVIVKGGGLLVAVNLVAMIPEFGWLLVLGVWFVGLLVLFKLEVMQVVTLVFINWLLNLLIIIAILRFFVHN